jgi:hypothetical protein
MNTCKKCNSETQGNFCSHCGHPQKVDRINARYIASEIGSVLNFQKGFFYTIKELLIRPGQSIQSFISEDRNRLVKPVMFLLICSLIYTIFAQLFGFKDGFLNLQFDGSGSSINIIFQWIGENYGYSNLIMSVFVAIWIKVFYRKNDYNYFEILILLIFISGMQMLMFSFLGAFESLTDLRVLSFGANLVIIYAFWAVAQFFGKRKILNYLKAPISYFLGFITFLLFAIGLGLIIDLIQ